METAVQATAGPVGVDRGPTAGDPSAARLLHYLTVVTPEGVVLGFRAAGIGSRLLAKLLDVIIQFVAIFAALILTATVAAIAGGAAGIVVILVTLFLVVFGYPALFETFWRGRTIGKKVLGIQVITVEGGPVGFRHSALRAMIQIVDLWVPLPGGFVALTSALLTRQGQRIGDLAAGTIVVREPKARPTPVFFPPAYGAEHVASLIDTSRLEPSHYALIREYLMRSGELLPNVRRQLGEQLARQAEAIIGSPHPPGIDPERYLVSVVVAHQRRWAPSATAHLGDQPATSWPSAGQTGWAPSVPPPPMAPAPAPAAVRHLPPPTGLPVR